MRRLMALLAALAVTPVIISAIVQVKPQAQGRGRGIVQDEAPIRVRNGSADVDTLLETQWVGEGTSVWSQDKTSPGFASPIAEVRYSGGGTCRLQGATITIKYKTGATTTKTFKVHRAGGKLKVTPKADFDIVDSRNPVTIRSKTGEFVTEVTASGTGGASCQLARKEDLREICIATTQNGLDNCR